jgi:non-heme chloroperoxidase
LALLRGAVAAAAAALAEQLGLPPLVVVGHSMGAANAFRLAIDRPAQVRGLVAIAAFAHFADKPDLLAFHQSEIVPLSDPVPYALAQQFQQSTVAGAVAPGWMHAMVAESLQLPAHVWRAMFAGLLQDDFSAELQRVGVPTLLAWGELDAYVPRTDQDWLLQTLPNARLRAFPGVGHALHWEQPEALVRELVSFVETLPAR